MTSTLTRMEIRDLRSLDWPEVAAIYEDGIRTGNATFETGVPSWEDWDAAHTEHPARRASSTAAPRAGLRSRAYSDRCCYSGVAEDSVYVASWAQGRGIGRGLLEELIARSEAAGIWTLQAGIFPENKASLRLHLGCGFRLIGVRERIGELDGVWRDVLLLERRSRGDGMTKVEAVVIRERIETVIDAVEEETGHVGVTVIEAVGHGRERGVTHEYRGRVFESRFLPKALLIFVVDDEKVDAVVARSPRRRTAATSRATASCGRRASRTSTHNRTGLSLGEVEVG